MFLYYLKIINTFEKHTHPEANKLSEKLKIDIKILAIDQNNVLHDMINDSRAAGSAGPTKIVM